MKTIDADLKVLAKINFAGKSYDLREINFEEIMQLNEQEDKTEATFDLFQKAGIPKEVSKQMGVSTIKQIEQLLVGELQTEKK